MSFWQILGRFAVSDTGETLQKVSDTTSVSSDGTTYTKMGSNTVGASKPLFKTPQHCASIEIQGAAIHVLSVRLNRSTTVCPSSLDQRHSKFKLHRPGVLDQPIKHFPVFPPVRCPN
jgi:hypothetical protein